MKKIISLLTGVLFIATSILNAQNTLTVTHAATGNMAAEITTALDGADATTIETLVVTGSANLTYADCQAIASAFTTDALKTLDLGGAKFENDAIPDASNDCGAFNTDISTGMLVTKVILPSTLKTISTRAFLRFPNLTSINLPEGLTTIEDYAFYECKYLNVSALPESLTSLDEFAFYQTSVSINHFPSGLTSFPYSCFNPNVNGDANAYRAKITSLYFHSGITNIGKEAFKSQINLTSIAINKTTPPSTGDEPFGGITLSNIKLYVPIGAANNYNSAPWNPMTIKEALFVSHATTGSMATEINNALSSAGTEASNIETLVITGTANLSYADCQTIANTFNTATLKTLDLSGAKFQNDAIPNSVSNISAFTVNGMLVTSVILPSSLKNIGDRAFRNFANLVTINLPESLTTISDYAFYTSKKLAISSLPSTLTSLGTAAFKLTSVSISSLPEGITSVPAECFNSDNDISCKKITSFTLHNGITSIGEKAFQYQSNLTSITVNRTTPPVTESNAFNGITLGNIDLYIPAGSVANYANTAPWEDMKIHELPTAIWTGESNDDWATGTNWQSGIAPGNTDDVLIPFVTTNYPKLAANTTVQHLIIEAGASLDLNSKQLSATSIKAKTKINSEKWYSIGFPFNITSVYSEDYQGFMTAGNHYWLNSYNGTAFTTASFIEDEDDFYDGYIIKLPSGFGSNKTISYVSSAVSDLEAGELSFSETYTLQANPTLADYPVNASALAAADKYVYQLNSDENEYQLIEDDDDEAFIAPFESVITILSPNHAPKITLDTDAVTGIGSVLNNEPVVETHFYNLQGMEIAPAHSSVFIVKRVYQSGAVSVSKIIKK